MAVLLTLGFVAAPHTAAAQQLAGSARSYAIAPGPLDSALNQYAAESGVLLAFDASKLAGLRTQGLNGRFALATGFEVLLAGTGWRVVTTQAGGYALRPPSAKVADGAAKGAPSASDAIGGESEKTLGTVDVRAARLATVSQLDRQMIRTMPAINSDLTSQLGLNPNIQYDDAQLSSMTAGEIAPAEISVHGSKPYQNELLVDGVSIANDLDPGTTVATNDPSRIPGAAQALAIDSNLLCAVEVRDSNVSAEYGRFTGGVVDATVCSARKKLGGSYSIGYTSSDWTHLFVDDARREAFENSTSADNQPRFRKWTQRGTLEMRPIEDFGVLLSMVRQQSDIPLKRFTTSNTGGTASQEVTQTRQQDTLIVKTDWSPAVGRHKAESTLVYAPTDNRYFIQDARNSDYALKSGGLNLGGKITSRLDALELTQQLSYSETRQSRRSDADYYRSWRWSADKNWGDPLASNANSLEGSWGDVDQNLRTLQYKMKAALEPVVWGESRHRFQAGLDLRGQDASYARLSDTWQYLTATNLPSSGAISRCQREDGTVDTEACSATPSLNRTVGQYFTRLQHYKNGAFDVSAQSYAAYVQDEMVWRDFTARLGVRADHDSLAGGANLAPRSSLTWQASEPLSLTVGANRYYGRSLFAFAMQEKINTLLYTQTRSNTLTWGAETQSKPSNRLADMKTPYDDEWAAGLEYESAWGPVSVRMTQRKGHDQVVKRTVSGQADCANNACYVYTNEGASQAKDFTVSWSSAQAFKLGPAVTRGWLAVNKSNVKSNYASYDNSYSSNQADDAIIQYDGRFIRYADRPADNYNRPWTLRVGAMTTFPAQHVTMTNILRVRDGFGQILRNGNTTYNGGTVEVWEKTQLPRALAWDSVIMWSPRLGNGQSVDVKLTIENLTNRKNKIAVSNTYATYERGRSVALELAYAF